MSDIEVIELGEDGSFDIPTTLSVSTTNKLSTVEYDEKDYVAAVDSVSLEESSLQNSLSVGEYKIYVKNNKLYIFLKLAKEESLASVKAVDLNFLITTNANKTYKILVPQEHTPDTRNAVCRVWEEFVTITADLK